MRVILACPKCKRQYDVTGKRVGTTVSCVCGERFRVRQLSGTDKMVMRCGSCGAGATGQAAGEKNCRYCGSDLKVTTELKTVCPECQALISDLARFCHACGVAIRTDLSAGDVTEFACPACEGKSQLASHELPKVNAAALLCPECHGLWLSNEVFESLAESAAMRSLPPDSHQRLAQVRNRIGARERQRGPMYRKCPMCTQIMHRKNYASSSGVILDMCSAHGVWLDRRELEDLIAWVRAGGLKQERPRATTLESAAPKPVAWTPQDDYGNVNEGWLLAGEILARFVRELLRP